MTLDYEIRLHPTQYIDDKGRIPPPPHTIVRFHPKKYYIVDHGRLFLWMMFLRRERVRSVFSILKQRL